MADDSPEADKPAKPVRPRMGKFGNDPSPKVNIPSEVWSNRSAPWQWHIEETFKGLATLAVEALKILALVNGGAAVALISFCGNLVSHGSPLVVGRFISALLWYCWGLTATMLGFIVAYFTQLRLYNEEKQRHEGKPFRELHGWLIGLGGLLLLFAVCAFGLGSCSAADAIKRTQPSDVKTSSTN